jgi:hypothetical protein
VQVLIVLTATPGTVSAERLQLLSVVEPQPRSAANQIPAELADGSPRRSIPRGTGRRTKARASMIDVA